jgi:hypothetical protein
MADAICDRLLHNAYKIEMKGDSMRRKQGGIEEGGRHIYRERRQTDLENTDQDELD